jgi:hypothetical protein
MNGVVVRTGVRIGRQQVGLSQVCSQHLFTYQQISSNAVMNR